MVYRLFQLFEARIQNGLFYILILLIVLKKRLCVCFFFFEHNQNFFAVVKKNPAMNTYFHRKILPLCFTFENSAHLR